MAVFGLLKLSEYKSHLHILPIAHDNLRTFDRVYMIVHPAVGEMYLSWQSVVKLGKAMPGMVLENADKDEPVKVLAHGSPARTESQYIWTRYKTTEDKPNMPRHPQLSRQQLTDLLDHAFSELEAWDKLIERVYLMTLREGSAPNAVYEISEVHTRIKSLIERLSEYK